MHPPSLSAVFTINERPKEVLAKVFASLPEGEADQWVICFDRTPKDLRSWVLDYWRKRDEKRVDEVTLEGEPGWRTGVAGWNAAFNEVRSEVAFCFSSEVIHGPDNLQITRQVLSGAPAVLFGKCRDSGELGGQTDDPEDPLLLCSAARPRPLGFIMALPTWALRVTGGYVPEYEEGYWYADDDFAHSVFRLGLPYIFDDRVHGTHQAHARAKLDTPEGQDGIARNKALFLKRWGELKQWERSKKLWYAREGLTIAIPEDMGGLRQAWERLTDE